MLSLKLPQLLRVHQVPRVRDSPTPTSQGTGWGSFFSFCKCRSPCSRLTLIPAISVWDSSVL